MAHGRSALLEALAWQTLLCAIFNEALADKNEMGLAGPDRLLSCTSSHAYRVG
jgi:hypothetical protein